MSINGWISNLTKNTASARMNFTVDTTNEEIEAAVFAALYEELRYRGRAVEATPDQWQLKSPIERGYPESGKSSARIRLTRKK